MTTPTLTHLALHVRDLPGMIGFYREHCGLEVIHEREDTPGTQVVWMAEPARARRFIFVFISGGPGRDQEPGDYSHLGFALESREAVDAAAKKGREAGCLALEPREEPYPVGYYCGLSDPDGNLVEFSYGQPLGPGAEGVLP